MINYINDDNLNRPSNGEALRADLLDYGIEYPELLDALVNSGTTVEQIDAFKQRFEWNYYGIPGEVDYSAYQLGSDFSAARRLIEEFTPIVENGNPIINEQNSSARYVANLVVDLLQKYATVESGGESMRRLNGPTEHDASYAGHNFRAMMIVLAEFRQTDPIVIATAGLHDMYLVLDEQAQQEFEGDLAAIIDEGEPDPNKYLVYKQVLQNLKSFAKLDDRYSALARMVQKDPEISAILEEALQVKPGYDSAFDAITGFTPEAYDALEQRIFRTYVNKPTDMTLGRHDVYSVEFEQDLYPNYYQLIGAAAAGFTDQLPKSFPNAGYSAGNASLGGLPVFIAMMAQAVDNSRYPRLDLEKESLSNCGGDEIEFQTRIHDGMLARIRDSFDVMINLIPVAQVLDNQHMVKALQGVALKPFFHRTINELQGIRDTNNARYLERMGTYNSNRHSIISEISRLGMINERLRRDSYLEYLLSANYQRLNESAEAVLAAAGVEAKKVPVWEFKLREAMALTGYMDQGCLLGDNEYHINGNSKTIYSDMTKLYKYRVKSKLKPGFDINNPEHILRYVAGSNDQLRATVLVGDSFRDLFKEHLLDSGWLQESMWFVDDAEEELPSAVPNYFSPIKNDSARTEAIELARNHGREINTHIIMQNRPNTWKRFLRGGLLRYPFEVHIKSVGAYICDDFPNDTAALEKHTAYKLKDLWKGVVDFMKTAPDGHGTGFINSRLGAYSARVALDVLQMTYNGALPRVLRTDD